VVRGGLGLATNGAILKRVTAVVSRPDDTLVWLRAEYGVAAGQGDPGSETQQGSGALLPVRTAAQHLSADAGTVLGDVGYSRSPSRGAASSYLSPTEQYARTQASLADAPRGTVINVRA
jgi:hypothetical protein